MIRVGQPIIFFSLIFEPTTEAFIESTGYPAGRYKVSVGQDNGLGAVGGGRTRRPYKLTFHPDTADPSQAEIVEVLEGGRPQALTLLSVAFWMDLQRVAGLSTARRDNH